VPESSKGKARSDLSEVGEFLLGSIERMNVGDFEISENEDDEFVVVEIRGDGARRLSVGDTRAIGALQLLANQAAMRLSDDAARVVIDCEGDADQRAEFLTRLASRAAGRARDSERSVALDPMNGRDRRLLHMAVREMDGVVTMSIGEGRYRQVVIVPEGAEEYDEAIEASEAAEKRERDRG
jgi:spoIIIJ-associated protein